MYPAIKVMCKMVDLELLTVLQKKPGAVDLLEDVLVL
jgi:hypothetical protein